jgi:hypothetical protein
VTPVKNEPRKQYTSAEMIDLIRLEARGFFSKLFEEAFRLAGTTTLKEGEFYEEKLLECADEVLKKPNNQQWIEITRRKSPQNPVVTDKDLEHYHDYILYMLDEVNKYGPQEVLNFRR